MTGAAALRVVLTGAVGTLDGLGAALAGTGLHVTELPLLGFGPPPSWHGLDDSLGRLATFAAVAITSPRAAEALVARAMLLGIDEGAAPPIWSGAASAGILRGHFSRVEVPSAERAAPASLAVRLAGAMLAAGVGSPVLFPCGEFHREELLVRLRAAGRRVEAVVAYHAVLAAAEVMTQAIASADVLVVTSPRVAQALAAASHDCQRPTLVAIGATTAEAAYLAGWSADATAARPTVADVVGAIHALLPSLT